MYKMYVLRIQNVAKCKNWMNTTSKDQTTHSVRQDLTAELSWLHLHHCRVLVMGVDFIRCFNFQSWININTDIIILSLHQWLPFSAPGNVSLPSAGCLAGQWLASQASEVTVQIGKFHLEPQTKLASLWRGTWIFVPSTSLLLIMWLKRPRWHMSPSISALCFPVLSVPAPARRDKARGRKSIFGLHDFTYSFLFLVFWGVFLAWLYITDTFSIQYNIR